jgi:hypothetical protein
LAAVFVVIANIPAVLRRVVSRLPQRRRPQRYMTLKLLELPDARSVKSSLKSSQVKSSQV